MSLVDDWHHGSEIPAATLKEAGDRTLNSDSTALHTSVRKVLLVTHSLCSMTAKGRDWRGSSAAVLTYAIDALAYLLDESLSDDELEALEDAQRE